MPNFLNPIIHRLKPSLLPMNGSDSNSFPLEARKNKRVILENMTLLFSKLRVRAFREKIISNLTAFIGSKLGLKKIPFSKVIKPFFWVLVVITAIIICITLLRSCTSTAIMRKTSYIIGRDSSWYSLSLWGKEFNLVAFTNELMADLSNETGLRFQLADMHSSVLLSNLDNGSCDAIIYSMRPDVINEGEYLFSELIYELGPVLIVAQDSTITSLKQMKGKTIAINMSSTTTFNAVREAGANIYDFILVPYTNINKAVENVAEGQIDGIILPALHAYTLTNGFYAGRLKVVTRPLTDEGLRIIALKNPASKVLIDDINKGLHTLKENGTYDSLIAKWNLIDPEKQFWHPRTQKN